MFLMHDTILPCEQIQCVTDYVLQDPLRWLPLCDQYRVSRSLAPNFAYALINARADVYSAFSQVQEAFAGDIEEVYCLADDIQLQQLRDISFPSCFACLDTKLIGSDNVYQAARATTNRI